MRESAVVTYNDRIIDYSIGTPTSVEFNFERIWEFKKKTNLFRSSFLEFIHIHPRDFNYISSQDILCATGFEIAFGFPIYFTIITFNNDDLFDVTNTVTLFKIMKGNVIDQDIRSPLSRNLLLFLKFLSYSKLIPLES